ncbi:MAG: hypothetical protein M0P61_11820 [Ignavibacteriaceae bacterium]|jgi:hypothetical protein|nr:hypothetical protein [Ignavibacteriaceae bacterium]
MKSSECLNQFGWRKSDEKIKTFFPERENFLEVQKEIEVEFLQKLNKDFGNRESQCKER